MAAERVWNPGDEALCPAHVRPIPQRDKDGRHDGKYVAVGVECRGVGLRMLEGKFCCDPDCGRDMTYKLKK